jgi:hypothetical protein
MHHLCTFPFVFLRSVVLHVVYYVLHDVLCSVFADYLCYMQ